MKNKKICLSRKWQMKNYNIYIVRQNYEFAVIYNNIMKYL